MFNSRDLGIDLGTANILVYARGKGIIINEPSVVAMEKKTQEVVAVGSEAKNMVGRTPGSIVAMRPMKDGVIADYETTAKMMKYFLTKAKQIIGGARKPRVVVCAPSGVTEVEKRAIYEATIQAGAKEVFIIEEPFAAAIGAGLPVSEPVGSMVVDIGGGTTEVAVISLGGIVTSKSLRVGGDVLDSDIIKYIKKEYKLMIGERTAESLKIDIGTAIKLKEETKAIRGRNLISGLPEMTEVSSREVQLAMEESLKSIVEAVKLTLEKCPPELSGDIIERGICLTGGGSLLKGMDKMISDETQTPVFVSDCALDCVAIGTGKSLENIKVFETIKKDKVIK